MNVGDKKWGGQGLECLMTGVQTRVFKKSYNPSPSHKCPIKKKDKDDAGFEPATSCTLSKHSTTWASHPMSNVCYNMEYVIKFMDDMVMYVMMYNDDWHGH